MSLATAQHEELKETQHNTIQHNISSGITKHGLNNFKYHCVPKMKLTQPIVQNIFGIGQLKLGGNGPSLIDICQILSPIQESSMHRCHLPEQWA